MRRQRFDVLLVSALIALVFTGGCDLAGILIKAQVDGAAEFTDAKGGEFADPEMVGPILAASTVTNEGNLYYVPEYEPLLQSTIFSNVAYGQAWLGAQAYAAEA